MALPPMPEDNAYPNSGEWHGAAAQNELEATKESAEVHKELPLIKAFMDRLEARIIAYGLPEANLLDITADPAVYQRQALVNIAIRDILAEEHKQFADLLETHNQ